MGIQLGPVLGAVDLGTLGVQRATQGAPQESTCTCDQRPHAPQYLAHRIPSGYGAAVMVLLWLSTLTACGFSVAGTTVTDTGPTTDDTADGGDDTADTDTGPVDTGDPPDPWTTDDDGDGFSEAEGDCDDTTSARAPGLTDTCDGVDSDCDDQVDEDARSDDPYEPNDTDPYELGSIEDGDHALAGALHNDADVDRYEFYALDHWLSDRMPVTITLDSIPDDATYRLTVERTSSDGDEPLEQIHQSFGSDTLSYVIEDRSGPEDGGDYAVWVEAIAGADCGRNYLLTISGE